MIKRNNGGDNVDFMVKQKKEGDTVDVEDLSMRIRLSGEHNILSKTKKGDIKNFDTNVQKLIR